MNQDEIIAMAREAGAGLSSIAEPLEHPWKLSQDELERFAALVAAKEREACAQVCDAEAERALFNWRSDLPSNQQFWNGAEQFASACSSSIRARGAA
jgi:hypothetical protein